MSDIVGNVVSRILPSIHSAKTIDIILQQKSDDIYNHALHMIDIERDISRIIAFYECQYNLASIKKKSCTSSTIVADILEKQEIDKYNRIYLELNNEFEEEMRKLKTWHSSLSIFSEQYTLCEQHIQWQWPQLQRIYIPIDMYSHQKFMITEEMIQRVLYEYKECLHNEAKIVYDIAKIQADEKHKIDNDKIDTIEKVEIDKLNKKLVTVQISIKKYNTDTISVIQTNTLRGLARNRTNSGKSVHNKSLSPYRLAILVRNERHKLRIETKIISVRQRCGLSRQEINRKYFCAHSDAETKYLSMCMEANNKCDRLLESIAYKIKEISD